MEVLPNDLRDLNRHQRESHKPTVNNRRGIQMVTTVQMYRKKANAGTSG